MKKSTLTFAMLSAVATVSAQGLGDKLANDFLHETKLSGYIVGKAMYTDQKGKNSTDFQIRHARASIGGKVMDVSYNFQMEFAGNYGDVRTGTRLLDAWAEWGKYKQFKVKGGQFKRCFTFECPMNPWHVDFGGNSQVVSKLSGFSDRVGEHSSGGRDIGLQLQGDLLPVCKDKHTLLHYQVGVYNGQGIDHNDANSSKDVIGGIWVSPVKGLDIAWFGWNGRFTDKGVTVDRKRMAYSMRYTGEHFYTRGEYIQSKGYKVSDYDSEGTLKSGAAEHADGWYALFGYKCPHWRAALKWDVYRDSKEFTTSTTVYGASFTYMVCPNLQFMANYGFNEARAASDRYYHTFDVQAFLKF